MKICIGIDFDSFMWSCSTAEEKVGNTKRPKIYTASEFNRTELNSGREETKVLKTWYDKG